MKTSHDPVKNIRAAITECAHIDPRRTPIDVRMDGDVVVIEGMVERVSQKKKIMLSAMTAEGVRGVVDRLLVMPSSKMSDAEIRDHVNAALLGESSLKDSGIKVEVERGIVDLEGTVGSLTHKRLAGVLAWWVPGASDVINSLEVTPDEADNAAEVCDALRIVFEKDRLVDASALTISVNDWVVTLGGTAPGAAECEAAEEDAWYVWGVNGVINNIKVNTGTR